jgi:hypothetical protein
MESHKYCIYSADWLGRITVSRRTFASRQDAETFRVRWLVQHPEVKVSTVLPRISWPGRNGPGRINA